MDALKLTDRELELVRNVSIHDVLGIQMTGRRLQFRCPFPDHNDSDPSFCLYPDNTFHCYGCDKHGNNALDFFLLMNGNRFVEAVYELTKFV